MSMSNWSPKTAKMAIDLNSEGQSRAQIAERLTEETGRSYTRNAVIGFLNRRGVKPPPKPAPKPIIAKPRGSAMPTREDDMRVLQALAKIERGVPVKRAAHMSGASYFAVNGSWQEARS